MTDKTPRTSRSLSRARFAADVVIQSSGDEAVVVKLADETAFALNATGARIAALITEGLDVRQIVERLAAEYALPPGGIEREVQELVDVLTVRGIIEVDLTNEPS